MKEFSILKDLSYKEKHWHEDCFVCSKCRTSLVDKQFGSKADRIYCGPCYDAQFATRCDGCGDVFRAGTVNFQFKEVFGNSKKYSLNQTSFSILFHFGKTEIFLKSKNFLKSNVLKSKNYCKCFPL